MTYTGDYVFTKTLTEQEKLQIQEKAITKLTEIIGVEVDNVMAVRNRSSFAPYKVRMQSTKREENEKRKHTTPQIGLNINFQLIQMHLLY